MVSPSKVQATAALTGPNSLVQMLATAPATGLGLAVSGRLIHLSLIFPGAGLSGEDTRLIILITAPLCPSLSMRNQRPNTPRTGMGDIGSGPIVLPSLSLIFSPTVSRKTPSYIRHLTARRSLSICCPKSSMPCWLSRVTICSKRDPTCQMARILSNLPVQL